MKIFVLLLIAAAFTGAQYTPAPLKGPNYADSETPTGAVNGNNTAFTLANPPAPALSLQLSVNGIVQLAGTDYTLASGAITFGSAPSTGAILLAFYRY